MPRRQNLRRNRKQAQDVSCVPIPVRETSSLDNAHPVEELKEELSVLMEEHLESLRRQAFLPDRKQFEADEKRLNRMREVSADYIVAMRRSHPQRGDDSMTEKPSVKLPGKVEKVIKPAAGEPEKAQIAIDGADPLYREIRIENTLEDIDGEELHLKQNDEVDVTVEADKGPADKAQSEEDAEEKDDLVA